MGRRSFLPFIILSVLACWTTAVVFAATTNVAVAQNEMLAIQTDWMKLGNRVESGEIQTLIVDLIPYNSNTSIAILPGMIIDGGVRRCRIVLRDADREELLTAVRTTIVSGVRDSRATISWGVRFLDRSGTVVNTLELSRSSDPPVSSFLNGSGPYVARGSYVNSPMIEWLERRITPVVVSFDAPTPRNCG